MKLINLTEIDANSAQWGGKALGMYFLLNNNFNVPLSLVISSDTLTLVTRSHPSKTTVAASAHTLDHFRTIREMIDNHPIDDEVFTDNRVSEALNAILSRGAVVRSSGSIEDGEYHSLAGCYETIFGAFDIQTLKRHIKICWKSAYTPEILELLKTLNATGDNPFSMLIQEQIQCEKSGVAFSMNPVSRKRNEIVLEANWGNAVSVVSGSVRPDLYRISNPGQLVSINIGSKHSYAVFGNHGVQYLDTPADIAAMPCLDQNEIVMLADTITRLRLKLNYEIDIEWGIRNGVLYLFQCRPITT